MRTELQYVQFIVALPGQYSYHTKMQTMLSAHTLDCCTQTQRETVLQASPRIGAQQYKQNFRLDCSDVDGAAPGWQPEWKRAAHARHASHRPATAPTHKHQDRAVR